MEGLHISNKIFDVGLWVSFVYSFDEIKSYASLDDIYEIIKQNQTPNVESVDKTIENMEYLLNKEYKPKKKNNQFKEANPSLIKKIVNKRLLSFFIILLEYIEHSRLMRSIRDDDMIDYSNNRDINMETLNEVKFACLLVGVFQEKSNEPNHYKQAREKLKHYSDFQFYFLDQLIVMFSRNPKISNLYVKNHLYDILFSNYFYFFGGDHNELNSYQKDVKIEKNLTNLVSIQVSKVIREKIFSIIRFIARDKENFENEVYKLQEILGTYSSNSLLVCEISELLFDLFEMRNEEIMKSVIQYKTISVLSYVSHHQLQKFKTSIEHNDMIHSLEAVYATFNILNFILLNENNRMIALEDNNTIDTLFSCLSDPRFKEFAYGHLKKLMTFDQTENNSPFNLIINGCYQKFKQLSTKDVVLNTDVQIIVDLFKLIQDICKLQINTYLVQKEFTRDIKTLPDLFRYDPKYFQQSSIQKNEFCLEFLKTLSELLFENENNKYAFEQGYRKLESFILEYFDQKPTSEVINQLIYIMLDGGSIKDQYSTIMTPQIIPTILKILCYCPEKDFFDFIEKFIKILDSSVNNQNSCVNIQLFDFILKMIASNEVSKEKQQVKLIEILGILAGFSITVKELKSFFYFIKEKSNEPKSFLLTSLFKVLQTPSFLSPESFFDLDGKSSGLELPTFDKWPTSKGYTISMWFRVETFRDISLSPNYNPRIYSFLNSNGDGFEAYFTSKSFKTENSNPEPLLFVSVTTEGKQAVGYFDFHFHEKVWYNITIIHSYPKSFSLSKNEVKLYINGKFEGKLPMKYPNIKKIDRGRIGTNSEISQGSNRLYRENPLNGQMSTIYLFDENLSETYIKGLYEIGPNYISIFHPSDSILYDKSFNFLFDGQFSSKILFCLNPKSKYKNEKILINNAYELNSEIQYIKLLSGTKICVTHNIKDIIGCLGGIKVLFPLFLNLDKIVQDSEEDSYLAYELLTLILDLLKNHQENQEEMILSRGFQVINFLLKQISPQHMCNLMVKLIPKFVSNLFTNIQLFNDAVTWILFDFKLWIYSDFKVQKGLIEEFIFYVEKMKSDYFRKQITIQKVLDSMRMFYWYQVEPDYSEGVNEICNPTTKKIIGKRPNLNEIQEIRSLFFDLIRIMTLGFPNQNEIDSMMMFLVECNDSKQLSEVLYFILEFIFGPNSVPISEMLHKHIEILYQLLNNKDEDVRVYSLKIIGKLITENQKLRQKYGFDQPGSFSFISSSLLKYQFTARNYDTLREILIGKISNPKAKEHLEDIDRFKCEFPNLFPVVFQLLLNAEQKVQERVIYDFRILLNSKEIKDNFIQQPLWQNYFIDLIVHSHYQSVTLLVVEIFSDLIFYSLINMKQGWKYYEEAIAVLHYHSFSDDAFHLTKSFLTDVSLRVTNLYISSFNSKLLPFNLTIESHSLILGNFFQFLTLVEEYLFYYYSISKELKKTQVFDTSKESPRISRVRRTSMDHRTGGGSSLPSSPFIPTVDKNPQMLTPNVVINIEKELPKTKSSLTIKLPITTPIFPEPEKSPSTEGLLSKTISMFRKPQLQPMFSCEEEINMSKDDEDRWLDLDLVDRLIKLMSMVKVTSLELFKITQFDQFTQQMGDFRPGGALRIALRFFRVLMKESEPSDHHLDMIRKILKQDVEAEMLYEKYSEIHEAVNLGNYDKEEEVFQQRVFNVLNILYEKSKTNEMIIPFISECFIIRKRLLEPKLKRLGDTLDEKHPLIKKNIDVNEIKNYMNSDKWKQFYSNNISISNQKVIMEEHEFYSKMANSRKDLMSKIDKTLTQIYNSEELKMKQMNEKKNVELLSSIETKRRLNSKTKIEDTRKLSSNYWRTIMQDVANERGAWGSRSQNVFWKLDKTENNNRMRTRLKIDYNPTDHTGAAHDSKDQLIQNKKKEFNPLDIKGASFNIPKLEIIGENKIEEEEIIEESIEERSLLKVYCEIITPMQAYSGQMEITTKRLLWVGDKENKCETFGANAITNQLQIIPKDKVWNISDIREIHLRRCRLVSSAMEIFMVNTTNYFFNFEVEKRNLVYKKILSTKPPNLSYEHNMTSPGQNFIQSGLTKLWVKRKISNFDYLMKLNTFAGRTYNDFNQYPVFPWVIKDYISKTLDLKSELTFRNFERPIGAQRNSRLEGLDQRYKDLKENYDRELQFLKESNSNERPRMQPPCHYGTHYSSSGVVVHLLIRLEPYTTFARILQGGKFDHSDRLFYSIPNSWHCCTSSTGDCKELIPEFFYCPEFLEMTNNLDLGTLQSTKEKIGNVILPAWASTPEEFIRLNREALESDYVSDHLHEWIDLIFGYKQKGKDALEAYNLFHPLTYEGYVNIQDVKDPLERRQIIAQIENYGQTPSQLLQRPHPKRQRVEEMFIPFLHNPSKLYEHFCQNVSNSPIVCIKAFDNRVITICKNGMYTVHKFTFLNSPSDSFVNKNLICLPFSSEVPINQKCFSISSKDTIYSSGHWDNSFKVTSSKSIQSIFRHKDVVSCLATDENYLVTGSNDTTLIVWEIQNEKVLFEKPKAILYGHEDEITCVAINNDLDMVVSGSKDKTCIIHTLNGKYVKSINLPDNHSIDLISLPSTLPLVQSDINEKSVPMIAYNNIVIYSSSAQSIFLYSINGKLLKSVKSKIKVACMIIVMSRFLIYGGGNRVIVRNLYDLSLVKEYKIQSGEVVSVDVTNDSHQMFVGLNTGKLLIFHCIQFKTL